MFQSVCRRDPHQRENSALQRPISVGFGGRRRRSVSEGGAAGSALNSSGHFEFFTLLGLRNLNAGGGVTLSGASTPG